jgi:Galactose mutarotase and related enzymes
MVCGINNQKECAGSGGRIVTIGNKDTRVAVSLRGAEMQSISYKSTEYLWYGDKTYWADRAINLFPYIARLTQGTYTYDDKKYNMDIHGFIKSMDFDVESQNEDSVTLCVISNETTLHQYPFKFVLRIIYSLRGNMLLVRYEVTNDSGRDMYFGIGGHPGFVVGADGESSFDEHYLEFGEPCCPKRITFSKDNFVNGEQEYTLEDGRIIRLTHSLFDDDALVLKNISKCVTLKNNNNKKTVKVEFPDMNYLGIWHTPNTDAPFVCIEPWSSLPSRDGIIEDIAKQPNLITLPEGETYTNEWSITIS